MVESWREEFNRVVEAQRGYASSGSSSTGSDSGGGAKESSGSADAGAGKAAETSSKDHKFPLLRARFVPTPTTYRILCGSGSRAGQVHVVTVPAPADGKQSDQRLVGR
jgi:hypothetical protein